MGIADVAAENKARVARHLAEQDVAAENKARVARHLAEQEVMPAPMCRRSALDRQVGGEHYKDFKIQPVEFIEHNRLPFLEGCVIKRMCRHGTILDLEKAIHEIELIRDLRYFSEGINGE